MGELQHRNPPVLGLGREKPVEGLDVLSGQDQTRRGTVIGPPDGSAKGEQIHRELPDAIEQSSMHGRGQVEPCSSSTGTGSDRASAILGARRRAAWRRLQVLGSPIQPPSAMQRSPRRGLVGRLPSGIATRAWSCSKRRSISGSSGQ